MTSIRGAMSSRLAATEHCHCGAARTVTETHDDNPAGPYETRGLWTMALCRTHPGGFHIAQRREPIPPWAPE